MKRAMIWVLVAAALALVVACGGNSPSGSGGGSSAQPSAPPSAANPTPTPGPAGVVMAYYTALKGKDCPAAYALLVDPLLSRAKSADNLCLAYSGNNQIQDFTIGTPYASGQVYGVPVTEVTPGGSHNVVLTVTNVNGAWKVSDTARAQ